MYRVDARTKSQARIQRGDLLKDAKDARTRPGAQRGSLANQILQDFVAVYLEHQWKDGRSHNTIANIENDYRGHIALALGHRPIGSLRREDMDHWRANIVGQIETGEISHRAGWHAVKTLKAILHQAELWDRITTSPATHLRLPAAPPPPAGATDLERVLTLDQFRQLLHACEHRPRARSLFGVAGKLGLRRSELIGLQWGDIDLDGGRLVVRRQVLQVGAGPDTPMYRIISHPKSRKERDLPLPDAEIDALRAWHEASHDTNTGAWVWPGLVSDVPAGAPQNAVAGAMNSRTIGTLLDRWLERAGLWSKDGGDRAPVTPHGLRHTAASVLLLNGIPLVVVSRWLGHADISITARVYSRFVTAPQFDVVTETWNSIC